MSTLLLFDIDGTLTDPMMPIDRMFKHDILELREKYKIGIISGSNLEKIIYQMGPNVLDEFNYVFAENGLIAFKDGNLIGETHLNHVLSENDINDIIHYVNEYTTSLNIPVKKSKFIEVRTGLINISPIGRDCTYHERLEFYIYDNIHKVREEMIIHLKDKFHHLNLVYVIGGMISFDVYPLGWDKTFCLQYLDHQHIIFFGNAVNQGGHNYTLYSHADVIGIKVTNYQHTQKIIRSLFHHE